MMIFCKSSTRGLVFITRTLRLRLVQQRTGVVWDQPLCSYEVKQYVEKDGDLLHSTFVTLLRDSSDPFVSKLLSGPGLAPERHMKDENIIVQAFRPLRRQPPTSQRSMRYSQQPTNTPILIKKRLSSDYPVQFYPIGDICLPCIGCIRPNDSGSSNSFHKRRVKAPTRSLLLPDLTSRRCVEYIANLELGEFCELEKDAKSGGGGGASREDDDDDGGRNEGTVYTHGALEPGQPYFGECVDDFGLSTRTGVDGARYQDPNMYGAGGLATPTLQIQEWNEWNKRSPVNPGPVPYSNASKESSSKRRRTPSKAYLRAVHVVSSSGSSGYAPGSSPPSHSGISAQ